MSRFSSFAILASILCFTGGCAAFNRMSVTQQRNTTIGQELIDLGKAQEAGLISKQEFARTRNQILNWADPEPVSTERAIIIDGNQVK